ncbi:amidohydrolase family protein [Paeniroseomonas aquatica]|uniref:Amidohydrolase family protein n=1 Tax=Paeniroseomonas aquatica TaxID=373043 RepID=A0ABT8A8R5_9PROT|nr:amidohydrolase family protein [Paeniroseomonas aquatica]MDN3565918.1 amidohydrolase family protein [Paeniroseomonas aquatica]
MPGLPIIDAHHHFWDLRRNPHPWLRDLPMIPFRYGDYAALRGRDFLPEDYDRVAEGLPVVATVTMEGEWDPADPLGESRWMTALAARTGRPAAHVAQAWLDRADAPAVLEALGGMPLVRGIRHKPRAAASPALVEPGAPGGMGDPRWRAGYGLLARHGLHFELQAPWWHLDEALALVEAHPATPLVLNHTGLPADRSAAGLAGWRAAMRRLAAAPQVSVKISGLGLAGRPWAIADNIGIIRETIGIFGAGRCMFASNFPVDGLCGSFRTIVEGFAAAVADLPEAERAALFAGNAARIYRLRIAGLAGAAGPGEARPGR